MKIKEPSAICMFCSKPGGQNPAEWTCPKCLKAKKEGETYYNNDIALTDCCNARARITKWECQFCGKLNPAKDLEISSDRIIKKPFSGANYTGREDSLSKVMHGTAFLKRLKKEPKGQI